MLMNYCLDLFLMKKKVQIPEPADNAMILLKSCKPVVLDPKFVETEQNGE
jgi:hypothetical protein